jgi:hypothetical protein
MSEQIHADKAEEQVSSESGLFLSAEPLEDGRLSATGDADTDATDTTGDDTDSGLGDSDESDTLGDSDASDSALTDADATDEDSDDADADGTDGGDSVESESGLGGENPLGINRPERVKNGDDKDTRDT